MKKVFLVLLVFLGLVSCRSPFTPDTNEMVNFYDLELTYIRTRIIHSSSFLPWVNLYHITQRGILLVDRDQLQKIDDYTFTFPRILKLANNRIDDDYDNYVVEISDLDAAPLGLTVAERIFVRVTQTGFRKELRDIRNNTINPNVKQGSKMAVFRLTLHGQIISEPQGQGY